MKAKITILTTTDYCECCGYFNSVEAKIEANGHVDYRSRDGHLSGNDRWQDESSYSEPYISVINLLGYAVYFEKSDNTLIESVDTYLCGFDISDQLQALKRIGILSPNKIRVTVSEVDYYHISASIEVDGEIKYQNTNCTFDSLIKEIVEGILKCEVLIETEYEDNTYTEDY